MELLWRALGSPLPPADITQEAFDRDDGHLRRLVRLRPGERAETKDLWEYTQDLRYTQIQTPLMIYLLPFCMEAWRQDLRGISGGYGGFVEQFYPVLADRQIFEIHLDSKQSVAISKFMQQTILEEIDDQRGLSYKGMRARPYRWVRALTTYGVLRPDTYQLWNAWWSLDTVGRAIAAVQYISCLMYPQNENPVFAPWTGNGGGGPPCLCEFEGHLYEHHWLKPNLDFLKEILTVRRVSDVLIRAADVLVGQPEHDVAAGIREDLPLCVETLEVCCTELQASLLTTQKR
jgi:hypothetical protein